MIAEYLKPLLIYAALIAPVHCVAAATSANKNLKVEFNPTCIDGDMWLSGTLSNVSDTPILIENGALPWDADGASTKFEVLSRGRHLERNSVFIPIGKVGPVHVQSKEIKSGVFPIEFFYPDIKNILETNPVLVKWDYWTSYPAEDGNHISGSIEIQSDACR